MILSTRQTWISNLGFNAERKKLRQARRELAQLSEHLPSDGKATRGNIVKLAQSMRDTLANTPVRERRGYIRAVVDEIRVESDGLQIMGRRSRLSRLVAVGESVPSPVPTFVRKWRKGWDSNPRMLSHRRFSRPEQSTTLPPLPKPWMVSRHIRPRKCQRGRQGRERRVLRRRSGYPRHPSPLGPFQRSPPRISTLLPDVPHDTGAPKAEATTPHHQPAPRIPRMIGVRDGE